ncbi:MAG: hypothetical protein IPJ65_21675 [Archangiaceae bacterium]|nr:hypothetical protein [Archangiaceae bacterium]
MPSRTRLPPLDLNALYRKHPDAGLVGFALNNPKQGGVDLDGDPQKLTFEEFQQGQVQLAPFLRGPREQAALAVLQQGFQLGNVVSPPPPLPALLGPGDVQRLQLGSHGIDMMAAAVHVGRKVFVAADTYDVPMTEGALRVGSASSHQLPALAPAFEGLGRLVGGPSWVEHDGRVWLYAEAANEAFRTPPRMFRAELVKGQLQPPEPVAAPRALQNLLGWPKVVASGDGFRMVYRDGNSQLHLASSRDGQTFTDDPVQLPVGAMHTLAVSERNVTALAYQQGQTGMTSFVRLARDGVGFGPPVELAPWSSNVHDTALLPRRDGHGFDAYYIATGQSAGFSLYRRAVAEDGALGPEQRLTDADAVGEASKPQVVRVGKAVRLNWAAITRRSSDGQPARQELFSALLAGDAPR